MKIVFNALALPPRKTGGGVYMVNLLRALTELPEDCRITVLVNAANAHYFDGISGDRLSLHDCGRLSSIRPLRLLWEQQCLPGLLDRLEADIFHAPGFVLPLRNRVPSVLTIFDMTFFSHPDQHEPVKRLYFSRLIPPSARKAALVITISRSSAAEIEKWLGLPPGKIRITSLAADSSFRPEKRLRAPQVLAELGLPERYILSVATLEPRKNIPTLIRAYARLSAELRREAPLVLAGRDGWGGTDLQSLVAELGLQREVFFTGYLPDEALAVVYAAAACFVYPSIYEGFGLPPLEAMASGTPVITGNISSLPEVVGDAGIMVDPMDTAGLAEAIERLLCDGQLAAAMSRKGLARAATFSWSATARATMDVYKEVLGCG